MGGHRAGTIVLALSMAAGACSPALAEPSPAERERIEQLLAKLAQDRAHRFERGSRQVSGEEAARFLRAKWQAMGADITTAEQFVDRLASRSSTTGQPYRVCTATQVCVPAGVHLRGLLAASGTATSPK